MPQVYTVVFLAATLKRKLVHSYPSNIGQYLFKLTRKQKHTSTEWKSIRQPKKENKKLSNIFFVRFLGLSSRMSSDTLCVKWLTFCYTVLLWNVWCSAPQYMCKATMHPRRPRPLVHLNNAWPFHHQMPIIPSSSIKDYIQADR